MFDGEFDQYDFPIFWNSNEINLIYFCRKERLLHKIKNIEEDCTGEFIEFYNNPYSKIFNKNIIENIAVEGFVKF